MCDFPVSTPTCSNPTPMKIWCDTRCRIFPDASGSVWSDKNWSGVDLGIEAGQIFSEKLMKIAKSVYVYEFQSEVGPSKLKIFKKNVHFRTKFYFCSNFFVFQNCVLRFSGFFCLGLKPPFLGKLMCLSPPQEGVPTPTWVRNRKKSDL